MNELPKQQKSRPLSKWMHSSLAKKTLLKMGVRIAIIIAVAAVFTYFHIFSVLNEQVDDSLQKYIVERGQKESATFLAAERNQQIFKQSFVNAWPKHEADNHEARFNDLFSRWEDGTWRLREKAFEGIARSDDTLSQYITGYVGSNAPQTNRFHNKLLLSYDLIDRYADAWAMDYANLYVSMPENVNLVYWPGVRWGLQADGKLDVNTEEWVYVANQQNNPQREPVWTGLYYDPTANEWMVSLKTPVDAQGEHLINVGTDILLNTLFEQVFNDHLDGAYNFIFRADGRIIAHPQQVDLLRLRKGLLHVSETNDAGLQHIITRLTNSLTELDEQGVILDDDFVSAKLAVTRIKGPELVFLFRVLRQQVLEPVGVFDDFARRFAAREFSSIDDLAANPIVMRRDEMGALALAMTGMARSIEKYETRLKNIVAQRTEELGQANNVLLHESGERKRITSLLQVIAKEVSGLQGEQFFTLCRNFLVTR